MISSNDKTSDILRVDLFETHVSVVIERHLLVDADILANKLLSQCSLCFHTQITPCQLVKNDKTIACVLMTLRIRAAIKDLLLDTSN